jgi:hypothetical protein
VLETPAADTHRQKNTADRTHDSCINDDMDTLITRVQQIMTGVQTADIEDVRFTVIMRAVYGLIMRKLGSQSAVTDRPEQLPPLTLSDIPSPQGGGSSVTHQQLSQWCKLNLVTSPHRDRCLDHTDRLREAASMQPVPVPVLLHEDLVLTAAVKKQVHVTKRLA